MFLVDFNRDRIEDIPERSMNSKHTMLVIENRIEFPASNFCTYSSASKLPLDNILSLSYTQTAPMATAVMHEHLLHDASQPCGRCLLIFQVSLVHVVRGKDLKEHRWLLFPVGCNKRVNECSK